MARWFIRVRIVALLLLLVPAWPARAQLNWRFFDRGSDDLEAGWPTYLSFSPNAKGNLWIRYRDDPMVTELDGFSARSIMGPDTSNADLLTGSRVYEGITGQLWTLYPEGVRRREGNSWHSYAVPGIQREMREQFTRVARPIPLLPAEHNRVFVLLADRLIKFNAADEKVTLIKRGSEVGLTNFSDMLAANEGGLWITAENGIARVPETKTRFDLITSTNTWQVHLYPPNLDARNSPRPFEDGEGGLLLLAEDSSDFSRVWLRFQNGEWRREPLPRGFKAAWVTPDDKAWGLEPGKLYQWAPPSTELHELDNVEVSGASDVVMEPGGAFWVSARNGVWRYAPSSWRPARDAAKLNETIMDIHESADDSVWFLGTEHLLRLKGKDWSDFRWAPPVERPVAEHLTLGEFGDGRLFFTDHGDIVTFSPGSEQFHRLPSPGGDTVRYLGSSSNAIWFVRSAGTNSPQRLAWFDGKTWSEPDVPQPDGEIGEWTTIMVNEPGRVWLGGTKGAAHFLGPLWVNYTAAKRPFPGGVTTLLDRGNGNVWAGTQDGVMAFNGQVWTEEQLGLGRATRLTAVKDGSVYLATEGELVHQHANLWFSLGAEEGVPAGVQVLQQTKDGRLWIGHDRGISVFHPEVDLDPPETYLDSPRNSTYSSSDSIVFGFYGKDRWKATSPERLLYCFRVDEGRWQCTSERRVAVEPGILSAGNHRFEVYALDRLLNRDLTPETWDFKVIVPWYQDYRVMVIVILAAIVVLVFASLAVNRHLTLKQSYAEVEKIVQKRTHELELANRELAHAEKMRSLGTLAAGVAHDFNSILSIIRGSIQIIEAHPENEEKVRTRISRIKSMVEQGSTLVKAMLGFSRADDMKLRVEDIGAVVEDTARLLSDRMPPEVDVVLDVTPGLPPVHGTRELLQQILVNLMLNALDAMDRHGQIALRCHRSFTPPAHWVIAPTHASDYVAVSVEDTGSGITPENLSRIFEPFFTTKSFSTRHGTGLGLSMVYEFCKEMGYGINVHSEAKKGTAFTIYVPVIESGTDESGKPNDSAS